MDTDGFRKAIHFDLDTATVEATFGKKNTSMAYRKIKKFLESNGFARCGLIQLLDRPFDTTRIAYQRHEW